MQNMAVNAASNAGSGAASATPAMAATAAFAAGAAAASTATMATVAGIAAAIVGASTLTAVANSDPISTAQSSLVVVCNPERAVNAIGNLKIEFQTDDMPTRTALQDMFVQAYNDASPGCNELFQRQAVIAKLDEVAIRDPSGLDTYWTALVSYYPEVPMEPLFGDEVNATSRQGINRNSQQVAINNGSDTTNNTQQLIDLWSFYHSSMLS